MSMVLSDDTSFSEQRKNAINQPARVANLIRGWVLYHIGEQYRERLERLIVARVEPLEWSVQRLSAEIDVLLSVRMKMRQCPV